MRKGFLVCITGIDGAGKTTAARALVEALAAAGIPSRYVYARYVPIALRPLMWASRALFLRGRDAFEDYDGHRATKREATSRHPVLAKAYRGVLLADYAAQLLVKIAIPRALGRNIVCDRYVHDTVVTDLHVDFNHDADATLAGLRRAMRLAPAPDVLLFLDLDPRVAMGRKTDVPSLAYLEERREAYLLVAKALGMRRIEAARPPDEVHREVASLALEALHHG